MRIVLLAVALFCLSCATTSSSYDSEKCAEWTQCGETAECAAHLYNRASAIMSEADQHARNHLYMTASSSYRKAAHMLRCADAKLAEAQLRDFDDWQVANTFGLGKRIKEAIAECDRLSSQNQWRR
jgi:hypothetical protein